MTATRFTSFCLLFALGLVPLFAQQFNTKDKQWRLNEELRARGLINQQHDFSPIDEAFASKEADQLITYYYLAKNRQFGYPRWNTPEEVQKTQYTDEQRRALNLEVQQRAEERLRQLSGLPHYLGERIETLATVLGKDSQRGALIESLSVIGDDESIVELGRFLFDDRNPDVTGPMPPLTLGVPKTIKYEVAGYLTGLLRRKPGVAEEIKAAAKSAPGWFERVQHWWLKSGEAAPYRRKLADLGVVLPPGYPPMAELKGAKTTISQVGASNELSGWRGWPLIVLLLVLLIASIWLLVRKGRGRKRVNPCITP
ncbi:hypothetical protein [Prosthecobacter sp.]|uniref:hypothetical protein n=1 Tax=Prosthecobacter sp. TaxID=1965333 RepID=UPI0025ECC548|nr:hypothetical protein [Prosthecobacter sp.]